MNRDKEAELFLEKTLADYGLELLNVEEKYPDYKANAEKVDKEELKLIKIYTEELQAYITQAKAEAVRKAQVKHAAEMSILDQEITSLKAKLVGEAEAQLEEIDFLKTHRDFVHWGDGSPEDLDNYLEGRSEHLDQLKSKNGKGV